MNWLTDCLDCQLSMSRVNGDVRGDSPTTHVDLLDQILGERLISPDVGQGSAGVGLFGLLVDLGGRLTQQLVDECDEFFFVDGKSVHIRHGSVAYLWAIRGSLLLPMHFHCMKTVYKQRESPVTDLIVQ